MHNSCHCACVVNIILLLPPFLLSIEICHSVCVYRTDKSTAAPMMDDRLVEMTRARGVMCQAVVLFHLNVALGLPFDAAIGICDRRASAQELMHSLMSESPMRQGNRLSVLSINERLGRCARICASAPLSAAIFIIGDFSSAPTSSESRKRLMATAARRHSRTWQQSKHALARLAHPAVFFPDGGSVDYETREKERARAK